MTLYSHDDIFYSRRDAINIFNIFFFRFVCGWCCCCCSILSCDEKSSHQKCQWCHQNEAQKIIELNWTTFLFVIILTEPKGRATNNTNNSFIVWFEPTQIMLLLMLIYLMRKSMSFYWPIGRFFLGSAGDNHLQCINVFARNYFAYWMDEVY